jgi:hypothetical protein
MSPCSFIIWLVNQNKKQKISSPNLGKYIMTKNALTNQSRMCSFLCLTSVSMWWCCCYAVLQLHASCSCMLIIIMTQTERKLHCKMSSQHQRFVTTRQADTQQQDNPVIQFRITCCFYIYCVSCVIFWYDHLQSCYVSKETIDLTVTRWTLWFKSTNIIILFQTKASLW